MWCKDKVFSLGSVKIKQYEGDDYSRQFYISFRTLAERSKVETQMWISSASVN